MGLVHKDCTVSHLWDDLFRKDNGMGMYFKNRYEAKTYNPQSVMEKTESVIIHLIGKDNVL